MLWLYIVAPILGASLAVLTYQFIRDEPTRPAERRAESYCTYARIATRDRMYSRSRCARDCEVQIAS